MPSPTWILFDHGQGVEVTLSLYAPPAGSNRPADAYVITECEGAFTRAARRAAEACYGLVRQVRPATTPLVVGFDLKGLQTGGNITGESGGLAMAIALAKALLDKDPGPVAATGVLAAGHAGTDITEVDGLTGKLAEAQRLLPEGGWLLLPADNAEAITPDIRAQLAGTSIHLRTVANLREALYTLFPDEFEPAPDDKPESTGGRYLGLGIALLLILIATSAWLLWTSPRELDASRELMSSSKPTTMATPSSQADTPTPAETEASAPRPQTAAAQPRPAVESQPTEPKPVQNGDPRPTIPAGRGFD